jgi:hypothetical protein
MFEDIHPPAADGLGVTRGADLVEMGDDLPNMALRPVARRPPQGLHLFGQVFIVERVGGAGRAQGCGLGLVQR